MANDDAGAYIQIPLYPDRDPLDASIIKCAGLHDLPRGGTFTPGPNVALFMKHVFNVALKKMEGLVSAGSCADPSTLTSDASPEEDGDASTDLVAQLQSQVDLLTSRLLEKDSKLEMVQAVNTRLTNIISNERLMLLTDQLHEKELELEKAKSRIVELDANKQKKGKQAERDTRKLIQDNTNYFVDDSSSAGKKGDLTVWVGEDGHFISLENKMQAENKAEHIRASQEVVRNLHGRHGDMYLGHIYLSMMQTRIPNRGSLFIETNTQVDNVACIPPPILYIGFENLQSSPEEQQIFIKALEMFVTYCRALQTIREGNTTQKSRYLELANLVNAHTRRMAAAIIALNRSIEAIKSLEESIQETQQILHEEFQGLAKIILAQYGTGGRTGVTASKYNNKRFTDTILNQADALSSRPTWLDTRTQSDSPYASLSLDVLAEAAAVSEASGTCVPELAAAVAQIEEPSAAAAVPKRKRTTQPRKARAATKQADP